MREGSWGELADNTLRCEARAIVVRASNPNSVSVLKPLPHWHLDRKCVRRHLERALRLHRLHVSLSTPQLYSTLLAWEALLSPFFSPGVQWKKLHLSIKVLPYGTWPNFSFKVKLYKVFTESKWWWYAYLNIRHFKPNYSFFFSSSGIKFGTWPKPVSYQALALT